MKFDELYHLKANSWQLVETPEKRKVSMEQCGGEVQGQIPGAITLPTSVSAAWLPSPCVVSELGLTSISVWGPCSALVQHAAGSV